MSKRAAKPWRRRKAASAVARKKGYGETRPPSPEKGLWRDKQGFSPEAYESTSRAETRGERRSSEK